MVVENSLIIKVITPPSAAPGAVSSSSSGTTRGSGSGSGQPTGPKQSATRSDGVPDVAAACTTVARMAIKQGSKDNISCMIVLLGGLRGVGPGTPCTEEVACAPVRAPGAGCPGPGPGSEEYEVI